MAIILTKKEVNDFEKKLRAEERGAHTVEKYVKCITGYAEFLKGRVANKSTAIEWKKALINKGFAPQTINGYLAAVKALHRLGKIHRRGDIHCTYAGDYIALSDAGILGRRDLAAFCFNALYPCDHHAVREHFNAQRLAARDKLLRHCHGAHG